MNAHIIEFMEQVEEKQACGAFYCFFPEFNEFNNTGTLM